jgi:hypothetical protein
MSYSTFNADSLVATDRVIVEMVIVRASTDAVVNVCDGTSASAPVVLPLAVKAGETFSMYCGVAFNYGVYVDIVSGNAVGTVVYS